MNIKLPQVKSYYILGSRPIQDWQRIFIVLAAICIGVFAWSYVFNFSIRSELALDGGVISHSSSIKDKETEIKETLDKYKAREVVFWGLSTVATSSVGTSSVIVK